MEWLTDKVAIVFLLIAAWTALLTGHDNLPGGYASGNDDFIICSKHIYRDFSFNDDGSYIIVYDKYNDNVIIDIFSYEDCEIYLHEPKG